MRERKLILVIVAVGLVGFIFQVNGAGLAEQASGEQKKTGEKNKAQSEQSSKTDMENETPFMCRLGALDRAQRERYEALGRQLRADIEEVKELPNGYAFRLPAASSTILSVAEWVTFERLCCPFFTFALEIKGEGSPLWLRMTGREGVKEFMQSELGIQKAAK
jgi:hypothetical protein